MNYSIQASSIAHSEASFNIKQSDTQFGIISDTESSLPNPAELFLGSLAACMLKNVERFSNFMKFDYASAEIKIAASRLDNPPKMDEIQYTLVIYTQDEHLNLVLLKKNLEKFGTIYNTIKSTCSISGTISIATK